MRLPTLAVLLVGAVLALGVRPAEASDNPYDRRQRELADTALRDGKRPAGVIPLLRLFRAWDEASPEVTTALLEELSKSPRLSVDRRAHASALLARAKLRQGDLDASTGIIRELGYVTDFRVVGPFDNEGKNGFDTELPVEANKTPVDGEPLFPGKERPVGFRAYPDVSPFGYVNFDAIFRPNQNACAFAETVVVAERAQPLQLYIGAGGALKLYWNGAEVLRDEKYRQPYPDRHSVRVSARAGKNHVRIKSCITESTWGFFFRVRDPKGNKPAGVTVSATDEYPVADDAPGREDARAPSTAKGDLAALEDAASRGKPTAAALENLARYLAYTGADDPAERRAKELAARAAELDPSMERLLLASILSDERAKAGSFTRMAAERYPTDPRAKLLQARFTASGPSPELALALLDDIDETAGVTYLEARALKADLLREIGLFETALSVAEDARKKAPRSASLASRVAALAAGAGRRDRMIEVRREAVGLRYDDLGSRRVLVEDAIARRSAEDAKAHLEALRQLSRDDARTQIYVAKAFEALERHDAATETFAAAREIAPEDATLIAAYAEYLLRRRQTDAASDELRRALALRPQDAELRELLEQIEPAVREDEAFAASAETLLGRRRESSGYPLTVLQSLTVNTVYDNGLGSSFRQLAAQIHDDEGARNFRSYSIQYDPDVQRVDVRLARVYRGEQVLEATQTFERSLGEPWYRVYYDTRALVVVFPDLEPGDVVELRYRIDDVAHRNLYADYYGDMHFLRGFSPTVHEEYVLITPKDREFYFNRPKLRGLVHEREQSGDKRIDRFVAKDVPALQQEHGMPGLTEIAPYLHVSTYRTWEEVGRWYWGLIRDQLVPDAFIKEKVKELIEGKSTTREKVVAIHNWVVKHTRYVALEFGIHGYKPYRVSQVVARGFGDCKDKASLLYAMLEEAGVDARIVLLRTRRNGEIGDLPASLAVFDHAIAYVPELELYLDGTAEHSGTTELPSMDQGVTVLVVGPGSAKPDRTPILPAEANTRERTLDIELAVDGSAKVSGRDVIRGAEAASYRSTYEAKGTRDERFERALGQGFPGVTVTSYDFSDLTALEQPVTYEFKAKVPEVARPDGDVLKLEPSSVSELTSRLARRPTRKAPLDLGVPYRYRESRSIHLPSGVRVLRLPEGGKAESAFGRLTVRVEGNGRVLSAETELVLKQARIAPDEYQAFRSWVEAADVLLRQQIELEGGAK